MKRVRRGIVSQLKVKRILLEMKKEENVEIEIIKREGKKGRIIGNYRRMKKVMDEERDIINMIGMLKIEKLRVREIE